MDPKLIVSDEGQRLLDVIGTRTITFHSEGTVVVGDLFFPPDFTDEHAWPAIVVCTGFTGIRDGGLPETALRLANAGYVALTIDYRGWGDSGGERGRFAPLEQVDDIRNALTYLEMQPFIDADRFGLWGVSFGGLTVPYTAAVDNRVKAAVGQVGVAHGYEAMTNVRSPEEMKVWEENVRKARQARVLHNEISRPLTLLDVFLDDQAVEWLTPAWEALPKWQIPISWESIGKTMDFRPIDIVHRIAPRALALIVATNDHTGKPESYRELFDAAREPKRWIPFDTGHFGLNQGPLLEEASAASIAFFDEFVRGHSANTVVPEPARSA